MNKQTRNLMIFGVAAVGGGWLGIWLNSVTGNSSPPMESLGALVWLLSPAITGLLLRWLAGDGWADAGICPNLPGGWKGYTAALVVYPVLTLVGMAASLGTGSIRIAGLAGDGLSMYITAVGVMFTATLFKNVFEELAWRGYLSPRLQAAGLGAFANACVTGGIWWAWHLPYYYYFLNRADLAAGAPYGLPLFLGIGLVVLVPTAAFFNEVRRLSGSVWGALILHGVVNAVSMPLVLGGYIHANHWGSLIFSPVNESLLMAALMGVAAWWMRVRSTASLT